MYEFVNANNVKININVNVDITGSNGVPVKSSDDMVEKRTINEDDDFECVSNDMF